MKPEMSDRAISKHLDSCESLTRLDVLHALAARIASIQMPHPRRVAIDGTSAAGKTRLASELRDILRDCYFREVIQASIDDFHNPKLVRYRRGKFSPEGYFVDSFNYRAILENLLLPLGPGGNHKYRKAVFNFRRDSPVAEGCSVAGQDAILLFDGVMLLREELAPYWDYKIVVAVSDEVAKQRAVERDKTYHGGEEAVRIHYESRILPGQKIYRDLYHPDQKADAIVDNNDFTNPKLKFRRPE